jgi:hypothetical protein
VPLCKSRAKLAYELPLFLAGENIGLNGGRCGPGRACKREVQYIGGTSSMVVLPLPSSTASLSDVMVGYQACALSAVYVRPMRFHLKGGFGSFEAAVMGEQRESYAKTSMGLWQGPLGV